MEESKYQTEAKDDCDITSNLAIDRYLEIAALGFKNGLIKLFSFGDSKIQNFEHVISAHDFPVIHLVFI